jgi:hypothetical protein
MECSICRPCGGIGVAASTRYNIVSGDLEASAGPCLSCDSHALLPSTVIASRDIRLILGLFFLVEWEFDVKLQSVPNALPDTHPFVRGMVVTRHTASAVDPGSGTSYRRSSSGRGFQEARVLHTALAIPGPARRHPVEPSAEDVAELFAAMAVHELRCVTKLITDHACIIASVILQCVVVVDDHGRIDIRDLLLVLHGVLGQFGS